MVNQQQENSTMGLDMFAYTTTDKLTSPVDFEVQEYDELYYWQEHPHLHGWMAELYYEKGGKEEFDFVPVTLTLADLDRLERDINQGVLPYSQRFFLGQSLGDGRNEDLMFVKRAREAIAKGYTVCYDSW